MPSAVLVTREGLGQVAAGDRDFGLAMFEKLLHTLEASPEKPQAICFYTEGVKLTCEGSPVIAALEMIAAMGVRLVVCQSCLVHYGLEERHAVGEVAGMKEILALLLAASPVITV